ncbi:unnamed protein product [Adineta steineri]|uniref:DYW domain-containing protein n=1 Tax=Adineta steineri TaxID=433720 RepID=A0A818I2S2_9BILA|nr:unnamed protein product [Adineta steineri]
MSNQLLNHRLAFLITFIRRSMIIRSDYDLGVKMKLLNDNKQFEKALLLFDKHKKTELQSFSSLMITQALKASAHLRDLQRGTSIHYLISSRINNDSYILASLIHFYINCGNMKTAQSLFDTAAKKSLSMYAAMMKGYIKNNQTNKAMDLFHEINKPDEVIVILLFNTCAQLGTEEALNLAKRVSKETPQLFYSNPRLLTSLLDALIKCGDMEHAQLLFDRSTKKVLSMYGAMMSGYNKAKNPFKTLDVFNQMKMDGIEPNVIGYTCVIQALSQMGDYSISESIIEQIPSSIFVDNQIHNALIDMWAIHCYGLNGMGIQAVKLYHQIPSELINESTNICVINACSHSGLVDQARSIFLSILMKTERIYTTMIDCLSRASFFDEAQQLILEYERLNSPVSLMYMALLSGARIAKNIHLSKQIYDRMEQLFPQLTDRLTSAAILLANVYGSIGEFDNVSDIRTQLNQSGTKKTIGLTSTAVNKQFYEFRAHDRSHPRTEEIHAEIKKISKELIDYGYRYDSSWITRTLNEDETDETVLWGHSERLAIAWNFVANPNTKRIQMKTNLRICGDCHLAIKLIALIRKCEIIIRDANRIHHFHANGQCSCNDYF